MRHDNELRKGRSHARKGPEKVKSALIVIPIAHCQLVNLCNVESRAPAANEAVNCLIAIVAVANM